ncbi:MAG: hypothetical protein J7J86_10350 [Bacteroidales bacterium]|nr:hypothetical protein [Bacteroidales bacterium]
MKDYLEEGKKYNFKVINKILFPDDNEYFVLQDPFGIKQLLKTKYYKNYNIKINSNIVCKVDKINCTGKIFLEPEHPYYKTGKVYDFDFVKFINKKNNSGNNENIAIVKDIYNNEINLILNSSIKPIHKPEAIKCRIERIKKGKIFLSPIDDNYSFNNLIEGKSYKFTVVDICKLADNECYFLLKGPFNHQHILKKIYFKDYEIKKGQKINCNVVRLNSKSYYYLEPEHPYYKIGEVYKFRFVSIKNTDSENSIIVEDINGNKIIVKINNTLTSENCPKYLDCKVSKIKKGRLYLEMMSD